MSTRPAQYASGLGFSKSLQTGNMKVFLNYLLHERKLGSQKKRLSTKSNFQTCMAIVCSLVFTPASLLHWWLKHLLESLASWVQAKLISETVLLKDNCLSCVRHWCDLLLCYNGIVMSSYVTGFGVVCTNFLRWCWGHHVGCHPSLGKLRSCAWMVWKLYSMEF